MTNTFLKNKTLESKYKKGIPRDIMEKKEAEDVASANMSQIMKKMHSPRSFNAQIRKFGSSTNYQNTDMARSIMLENHKQGLKHSSTQHHSKSNIKYKNMGSL